MTAPGNQRRGVGLRHIRVYPLDEDGDMDLSTTTVYEGYHALGGKQLDFNIPEPEKITHQGDDVVLDVDYLPASEAGDMSFLLSGLDDGLEALIGARNSVEDGEMRIMAETGTDVDQDAEDVAVHAFRQSIANGVRRWESIFIPKAKIMPVPQTWDRNGETRLYRVYPGYSSKHIWGSDLDISTEGVDKAQMIRGVCKYKPKLVGFEGDGTTTQFPFNASYPAVDTDHVRVWVDGTLTTTAITVATTGVDFTTAPSSQANIIVRYQHNQPGA